MKHIIYGAPSGEDFPTFEIELPLTLKDLEPIMGWLEDDDFTYDYRLTIQQINDIKKLTSLIFPAELDLYLTCED